MDSALPLSDTATGFRPRPQFGRTYSLRLLDRGIGQLLAGDVHTFKVCCRVVRGFALSDEEALIALTDLDAAEIRIISSNFCQAAAFYLLRSKSSDRRDARCTNCRNDGRRDRR